MAYGFQVKNSAADDEVVGAVRIIASAEMTGKQMTKCNLRQSLSTKKKALGVLYYTIEQEKAK